MNLHTTWNDSLIAYWENRGWNDGYHMRLAAIGLPMFQADYARGYRDGWNYAHHDSQRNLRVARPLREIINNFSSRFS